MQPLAEPMLYLALLSSSIRAKAETSSEITATRSCRLLDCPFVEAYSREELSAGFPLSA
jgi:hypothetical protein